MTATSLRRDVMRYGLALAFVSCAQLLTSALGSTLSHNELVLFFAAVAMGAYVGGLGPGLLATALSVVLADYYYVPPIRAFWPIGADGAIPLAMFAAVGASISLASNALRAARDQAFQRGDRLAEQARRMEALQGVASALATALTDEQVGSAVLRHAIPAAGAEGGAVAVLSEDGREMPMLRATGFPEAVLRRWRHDPLTPGTPGADAIRDRESIYLESPEAWVTQYPDCWAAIAEIGLPTLVVIPLLFEARTLGVLSLAFRGARHFQDTDRAYFAAIAGQVAQAVERTRLYEAERRAHQAAEMANRAKSEFLRTMSHELRTPLNAIGGYADIMEAGVHGDVTPAQTDDLRRIKRAGRHLLGLITDILNFARLEGADVRFTVETVFVSRLISEASTMIEPQARAKGLTFSAVPCDPGCAVRGDYDKTLQIVLNLLSNAVKFTRAGGSVTLSCAASARDPEREVQIVVHDTGRGIPADQLSRVFEPFVQVGRTLAGGDEGAGLGLAISRELARRMGGELLVDSEPGVGSTFVLALPHERSGAVAAATATPLEPRPAAETQPA